MPRLLTFLRRMGLAGPIALCATAVIFGCATKEALDGSGGGMNAGAGGENTGGSSGSGGAMVPETCGNGMRDPGEDCDDENDVPGDGCENDCTFTCEQTSFGDSLCSDGIFCNGNETCGPDHVCVPGDPVPPGDPCGSGRVCLNNECITPTEVCGDGLKIGTEECDDSNTDNGDGCDSDCKYTCSDTRPCVAADDCAGTPVCNPTTHMCVPGTPLTDGTACPQDSTRRCYQGTCTGCGNGVKAIEEECDDGDYDSGDGCEPNCTWTCVPDDTNRNCGQGNPCLQSGVCNTTTHMCSTVTVLPDGTACGSGLVCIHGNCLTSTCGDTVFDPQLEECDDTNNIAGDGCADCQFECTQASECTATADACRTWDCIDNTCVSVADAAQNTLACDLGAGASTCKDGACTNGTCGDGFLATGETCDYAALNGQGLGCDTDCTVSCTGDADCDNGDPCDGVETCNDVSLAGTTPMPMAKCDLPVVSQDTTPCGSTGEKCFLGVCRAGFCGDGVTDGTAGEECDPPTLGTCSADCKALQTCNYNGYWALKNTIPVSWPGTNSIDSGTGYITQWVLLRITQLPAVTGGPETDLDIEFRVCGLTSPDFKTRVGFITPQETYGNLFPNSLFDSGRVPRVSLTGTIGLSPGSTLTTSSVSVVIGGEMADPFGPWPNSIERVLDGTGGITICGPSPTYPCLDHDGDQDGKPGITSPVKSGSGYSDIIVNAFLGRADRMYLVVRQISSQWGVMDSCTQMTGTVQAEEVETHIVGCHRSDITADCAPAEIRLSDSVRPRFEPSDGTAVAVKIDDPLPTCSLVRSTLP